MLDSFEVGGRSKRSKVRKPFEGDKGSSPIDETAQDEIISELRRDAERLNRNGRSIFCCVLLLVAAMHALCLTYSCSYPFEMQHQVNMASEHYRLRYPVEGSGILVFEL